MANSGRPPRRLKTADDYTQAAFLCPLCQSRVLATKAEEHLKKSHAGLERSDYLKAVQQALQAGTVRFELSGRHDRTANPNKLHAEFRRVAKGGVRAIFRG